MQYMVEGSDCAFLFTMATESKEKHIVIVGMVICIFVDWRKNADV
jgi:hypothetical protein